MVRHGYTLRRYTVPAAHEGWYTPIICRGATLLTRLCGCPLWLIHVCEALAEEHSALMRTYTREVCRMRITAGSKAILGR